MESPLVPTLPHLPQPFPTPGPSLPHPRPCPPARLALCAVLALRCNPPPSTADRQEEVQPRGFTVSPLGLFLNSFPLCPWLNDTVLASKCLHHDTP